MGGNALKTCTTRRYQAAEYHALAAEMLAGLRADFPDRRAAVLPAYRTKPDFGDMDVLIETANDSGRLRPAIEARWAPAELVPNGGILSFECRQLQVDLIGQKPEDFDTALAYYSWNDLGNMMGRIAHKLGVRYGHTGLSAIYRDGTHQFDERTISKDTDRILAFLGYDPLRWAQGFDTIAEIYAFAASSPYFNPAIFAFENRNHTARTRDRKRAMFSGFLTWMDERPHLPAYPWPCHDELGGTRFDTEAVARLLAAFPDFAPTHAEVLAGLELRKRSKALFGGERVAALTGLSGEGLGRFMRRLATDRNAAFHARIVALDEDGTRDWILTELDAWRSETAGPQGG